MSILNPVLKPALGPIISFVLFTERTRTTPGGPFTYIQTDGTNYFQPDGSSLYLIP